MLHARHTIIWGQALYQCSVLSQYWQSKWDESILCAAFFIISVQHILAINTDLFFSKYCCFCIYFTSSLNKFHFNTVVFVSLWSELLAIFHGHQNQLRFYPAMQFTVFGVQIIQARNLGSSFLFCFVVLSLSEIWLVDFPMDNIIFFTEYHHYEFHKKYWPAPHPICRKGDIVGILLDQ